MDLKDIKNSESGHSGKSDKKKVGFLLGLGIFFMPYFFSWLTLRKGYSKVAKGFSFAWMFLIVFAAVSNDGENSTNSSRGLASNKTSEHKKEEISFIENSCSSVSSQFGTSSKLSNIQKKEMWKKFKGKAFEWDLEVTEVSETMWGDGFQVQFKCKRSNAFVSDIIVSYPNSAKSVVMKLQKGSLYSVKGKLDDYNSLVGLSADSL